MINRRSRLIEKFAAPIAPRLRFSLKHSRHASRKIGWLVTFPLFVLAIMPCPGMAQSAPAAESAKGVQILLLGTAAGPPIRVERSEPSSLLIVDGREYLIDCGIGTIRRMARADIRSETIGTIFFTHLHPDHALGLADVMANDYWKRQSPGAARTINIYGPPQTAEFVEAAQNYIRIPDGVFGAEEEADGIPRPITTDEFVAHEISQDGLAYQDDEIRVIAAENTHYVAKIRARFKSYSYRLETPYGVIVFTGDTGPSDAVTRLAKGADVLVTEASIADRAQEARAISERAKMYHWSPELTKGLIEHFTLHHLDEQEIGEMATKAQVKAVILHHFNPEDPAAYVAGVKKYYSGPVFAGADLQRYCLGAGTDTEAASRGLQPCH